MRLSFISIISATMLFSCSEKPDPQVIIDRAIIAHGGQLFETKNVEFDFRNKHYSVQRSNGSYTYTREYQDDSLGFIKDVLVNSSKFSRYINDTIINITHEWKKRYTGSVNSVLYFIQLPYGLNDDAVVKKYLGEKYFGEIAYDKIKITFKQAGGGEDFEDVFIYWINKSSNTVDYLAYSYKTDGGGTRFRQAINRRNINGIVFQDYINFKADSKDAPIESHDDYFIKGTLKELSRIESENVKVY